MQKENKKKINKQSGVAMLVSVIFFLFISLAIITGLVTPALLEFKNVNMNLNSKMSYYLAESGNEDAFYRLKNNKPISNSETIVLGDNSETTTISSIGNNQKTIDSIGDVSNHQRKVSLSLRTGDGAVFKYGTQSGQGGIEFANNSGLIGSLYSNGDIVGSNGAYITGDAFAANSPAVAADQTNGETGTPPNSVNFGYQTSTQDFAQSFKLENEGFLSKVQFYIKKNGAPANATVMVVENYFSSPAGDVVATGTLNASLITDNYGWIDVNFNDNPRLANDVTYWLVIDCGSNNNSNIYYTIAANTSYANGVAKIGKYGNSWSSTSKDGYFSIFLGGETGTISNIDVGTSGTGNAYAHTVIDSDVTGTIYCQEGSGNNKSCNTSKADPTQVGFPISDAMIEKWKNDAEDGGTWPLPYIILGSFFSDVGPMKIDGDLWVYGTLNLTNTVWVTGDIYLKGHVKLDPAYGNSTGIIIADGRIHIYNNSTFEDSGTPGSYIMLLSTSNCDQALPGNPCGSENAIDIDNNSTLIIANAQKGAINFKNNSKVKEMVANRIYLGENSTVEYGSGIMNVNFTSGPSGGWAIDSWGETK